VLLNRALPLSNVILFVSTEDVEQLHACLLLRNGHALVELLVHELHLHDVHVASQVHVGHH
jgi:hypothetical protein